MNKKVLFCSYWLFGVFAVVCAGMIAISLLVPFSMGRLEDIKADRVSMLLLDNKGRSMHTICGREDSWTFWINRKEINPHLINAIIASEDERFYEHYGVDPISVARACYQNVTQMRRLSGASTLTMQLMRMSGRRQRTLSAKIIEMVQALQCESELDKDQILEWYLNLAPFGGNFYGVEAASLIYFNKHSKDLNLAEAALLCGLVQGPSFYRPDRYPDRARERRNYVLKRMLKEKMITKTQCDSALKEKVNVTRHRLPRYAPHFSRMVYNQQSNGIYKTTLDRRIQSIAVTALNEKIKALSGVDNGAVVVIENSTGAVRALVGSNGFFDEQIQGQVNLAVSPTTPGSTLKPFIFAKAINSGICTPEIVINDSAMNFGNYYPKNYDNRFHGPVSIRKALAYSYNIPAVDMLNRIGVGSFLKLMRSAGITTFTKSASFYGLPIALGSAEVSLLELTTAYSIFSNQGVYRPYYTIESNALAASEATKAVLSPESAWMTMDMLMDDSRLNGTPLWKTKIPNFAWKTGTGYGHHAAWTIANTPRYTIGVLLRNASNKPSSSLVGISAAAPVAARIASSVDSGTAPFTKPATIKERKICAETGQPAGQFCKHTTSADYIPAVSNTTPCTVHELQFSDQDSLAVNDRSSSLSINQNKIKLLSPADNQAFVLIPNAGEQVVKLKATGADSRLYWFIDGVFYTESAPNKELYWTLVRGDHRISCSDSSGNTAISHIVVK